MTTTYELFEGRRRVARAARAAAVGPERRARRAGARPAAGARRTTARGGVAAGRALGRLPRRRCPRLGHRAPGRRLVSPVPSSAYASVRVLPGIERLRTLIAPARTQAAVGPRRSPHARRRARARRAATVRARRPRRAGCTGVPPHGPGARTSPTATPSAAPTSCSSSTRSPSSPPARESRRSRSRSAPPPRWPRRTCARATASGVVRFGGALEWLRPGSGVAARAADRRCPRAQRDRHDLRGARRGHRAAGDPPDAGARPRYHPAARRSRSARPRSTCSPAATT